MADFELLPCEILTQILLGLPTTASLYSLIRGSPRCYQIFLASKERFLLDLTSRAIHPAALADALAAVVASQLKHMRSDRDTVLNFIQKYEKSRHEPRKQDSPRFLRPTAVSLCQLHRSARLFIEDMTIRSTDLLAHCLSSAVDTTPTTTNPSVSSISRTTEFESRSLSRSEEGRLQRAFYRHELFGHLFNSDMEHKGENFWEHPFDSRFFLKMYHTWYVLSESSLP